MGGEAKRKRKLRNEILAGSPPCIYCGDTANTVDHFPPRITFALKQRPKGLEFPACDACNRGGKDDEQIAAFMVRTYPDPKTKPESEELQRIVRSISNNFPDLMLEIWPEQRHQIALSQNRHLLPKDAHALNASGPLLNRAILSFAAKLCCAIRFEVTKTFISKSGVIEVRWMSNYQAFIDDYPPALKKLFPVWATLQQGRMSVVDQFRYASTFHPNKPLSFHMGVFREAFVVYGIAADDASYLSFTEGPDKMTAFRPGWLRAKRENHA